MDAAEQVNDNRTGSGLTCGLVLAEQAVRQQNAQTGPGLVSSMYMMELPASAAWLTPIGLKIPWLMALFRNSTFDRFNKDGNQRQQAVG